MSTEVYFNPWDESYRDNPYPHYEPLYGRPPHLMNLFILMALVARYADALAILRDPERFSSLPPMSPYLERRLTVFGRAPRVVFSDPPIHTRLRRLVSKAFTSSRIKELEPRIREFTATLLDRAARKGEFEVMGDLANPLPVMVIAEMLGVSQDDYEQFKQWSDKVVESDMVAPGVEMPEYIINAFKALSAYFIDEIEKRRCNPGSDLISALVTARDEADALSEEELIAFVVLLLLAGNETTTNLIGNGMLALGRNPDQLAKLRGDLSLMPRAIEEMLRYDGPVQSTARYPKIDVEVSGVQIPANTPTFVIVAAANRDPAQFPEAHRFDVTRMPNDHLAFGYGIHFCLGAPLARMEGAIAIRAALERFGRLRIAEPEAPLTYRGSYFLRGLSSLKMALE
ncbi:MAG: cytochrome P450 [Candidatus Binataceae bacterium]|jgi:cytochrome P450